MSLKPDSKPFFPSNVSPNHFYNSNNNSSNNNNNTIHGVPPSLQHTNTQQSTTSTKKSSKLVSSSSSEHNNKRKHAPNANMAGYNLNFPTVVDSEESAQQQQQQQEVAKFSYKDILTSKPISMLPNNLEPTFKSSYDNHSSSSSNKKSSSPPLQQQQQQQKTAIKKQIVTDIPIVEKKKSKKFTLADQIGEEITQKLKPQQQKSQNEKTLKQQQQSSLLKTKKSQNINDTKKSISKMNRVEKAFLSKGGMKGMKPIRLEIRSEDASKITNEDVYNAFIKAVKHSSGGGESATTTATATGQDSSDPLVTILTKKKKPNKLKKLIVKEKEIRKLHNIAPNEYLDVKKFLKNLHIESTATTTTLEENNTASNNLESSKVEKENNSIVIIEIVPEKQQQQEEQDNPKKSDEKLEEIVVGHQEGEDGEEVMVNDETEMDILSVAESMEVVIKNSHERKIREYVNYPLDPDYENIIFQMLTKLQFYQFRLKKTDKKKFKQRLRYVIGIREVLKGLKLKRIRAIVVAPNIDKVTTPGGLDTKIEEIIQKSKEQEIPIFFALTKKKMGTAMKTSTKISVVGLYSMDGAFDEFKKAKQIVEEKLLEIEKKRKEQEESNCSNTSIITTTTTIN